MGLETRKGAATELAVKPATEADVREWLELAREVGTLFGHDMASDPRFEAGLKRHIERGTAFCVHVGQELAGAMLFREQWIAWLAVCRRFQRRGVGRALVAHCLAAGEAEIWVGTFAQGHPHADSRAARQLYCAMGFDASGEPLELAPDGTAREMLVWRRKA
jgi:GNAT superfamily N-acetyltransferase